jgi:hypothetical protein
VSTRIDLKIQTGIDLELFEQGVSFRLIRLITRIRLQTEDGWTKTSEAIVDTGSVVSVFPHFIWKDSSVKLLSSHKVILRGLAPQKKAILQADIAEITCVLFDGHEISRPLKIKAYLLPDDSVPLILGFEDILTTEKLVSDYKNNIAFLDI